MARHSYKFNPDSLSYDKVKKSYSKIFFKYFSYFLASIVLAVGYYIVLSPIYSNPEERKLKREVKQLSEQYDSLNMRYKLFESAFDGIQERDSSIYRSIFFSNPVSPFGVNAIDDDKLEELSSLDNIKLTSISSEKLSYIEATAINNKEKFKNIIKILTDSSDFTSHIPSIQPVENENLTRIGASIGIKVHPFYKTLRFHEGVDLTVPIGADVFATANGTVSLVESSDQGKGTTLTIDHGYGYKTVYAHLSKVVVAKGSKVKRGQVIALSGDSGMSIWPHLHYEVWKNGKVQNPISYFFAELSPDELHIAVKLSSNNGQSLD